MVSETVDIPTASITQPGIVGLTNDLGTSETLAVTQKALNDVATAKADKTQVAADIAKLEKVNSLSVEKSGKDENGVFTTITYKRKPEGTLYATSVLSGGESPHYTTRTLSFYNAEGSQVAETFTYSLAYDEDGVLISEV